MPPSASSPMFICSTMNVPYCLLDDESRRERDISRKIDEDIRKSSLMQDYKLLLLGAGEAGKSTFVKQMKILYGGGYTDDEIKTFKMDVINNVIDAAKTLIKGMDILKIPYEKDYTFNLVPEILNYSQNDGMENLDPQMAGYITDLWRDKGIKQCFMARGVEVQIPDSASHFLESADRITKTNYVPTSEDILLSRKQTLGIIEYAFNFDNMSFSLVDVGGQRGERKKWMHCFNDVTAVLFLVAVSEYDQVLLEDGVTNRLVEAVRLFKSIITNDWFKETNIILFLNKKDLFEEKIERVDLADFFPKYNGPKKNAKEAMKFIKNMFEEVNEDKLRKVHTFDTVAVNPDNTEKVFLAVKVILFERIQPNII